MSAGRDQFVNPYTFVSVPKDEPEGWRTEPAGHGRLLEGRCSGVVEVELTARSPLLLRGVYGESESNGVFPRRVLPGFEEPVPYLPGSSLAGAVRSLHETLTASCLRVFNGDFRPGYRDQVHGRSPDWRLARVHEVDENGRPTRMQLCSKAPVWVESAALHGALGGAGLLRTGARLTLSGDGVERLGRRELEDAGQVRAGGDWVVLVSDSRTRHRTRRNPDGGQQLLGRYLCPVGQLDDDVRAVRFEEGVWEAFLDAVDDTDDMRRFRQRPARDDAKPYWVDVFHPGDRRLLLGRRIAARRRLYEDQVVWVRPGPAEDALVVDALTLAAVWRHAGGEHKARERVPQHTLACTDPLSLCPSCRLFGTADTEGAGRGRAEQNSYRGHVRFGDAVPREAYPTRKEWLPPMGAPKPGAGQFYLNRADKSEGRTADGVNARPLREWGSEGDDGGKRRGLRGRKQYWLTKTPADRPYFRATEQKPKVFHEDLYEPDNAMLGEAESVAAGAVFTARVSFENLADAELGGLLCALDPALLLREYDGTGGAGGAKAEGSGEDIEYGWAVGGGRPLGFGTVTSRVTAVSLHDAASRYLGGQSPSLEAPEAVAAFRDAAPTALKDVWKRQLTKVLRLDWAVPHQVWYPPAGYLPGPDEPLDPQALLPSFTFWKETTGGVSWTWSAKQGWKKGAEFPYRQLPAAAAANPGVDAIRQQEKGQGNKRPRGRR